MRYLISACALVALSLTSPAFGSPIAPPAAQPAPSAIVAGGRAVLTVSATAVPAAMSASVSSMPTGFGVAATQVATTGRQTLTVARDGTASGGTLFATALPSNFIVPQNVQAILDFSNGAAMSANKFVNNGTVYCVSSNPNVTHAAIDVKSFLNGAGAELSTALSLSINSKSTFANLGTITAGGDLEVTAATSVANLGTLRSQYGSVTFSGTTAAFEIGNIGHIYAPNGSININLPSRTRNTLDITGGQWTAKAININAPNARVQFVADDISAQVNVAAKELQIGALWNAVNLGTVPKQTTLVNAPAPEALPVSSVVSRFDDADYVADTAEDSLE